MSVTARNYIDTLNAIKTHIPAACILHVSCLAYRSTLKKKACSSETWVKSYQTTRRYILEDSTLHSYRCGNLKSNATEKKLPTWKFTYKYSNVAKKSYWNFCFACGRETSGGRVPLSMHNREEHATKSYIHSPMKSISCKTNWK
jgi:hypothetical protein